MVCGHAGTWTLSSALQVQCSSLFELTARWWRRRGSNPRPRQCKCRALAIWATSPLVRMVGLEPTRPHGHQILSLARLPITTHPRVLSSRSDSNRQASRHMFLRHACIPIPPLEVIFVHPDGFEPPVSYSPLPCKGSALDQTELRVRFGYYNSYYVRIWPLLANIVTIFHLVARARLELALPGWKPGVLTPRRTGRGEIFDLIMAILEPLNLGIDKSHKPSILYWTS